MSYIKFLGDETENIYDFDLSIYSYPNKVKIAFNNNRPSDDILLSGFYVMCKTPNGEFIDGSENTYLGYTTMHKDDEDAVILSNDGSVYVEPEPQEPYIQTEEELAEQEKQSNIQNLKSQISGLKTQLAETDYIFIKCYEASLVGKTIYEYNFEALHAERQLLREQINQLKTELSKLETE